MLSKLRALSAALLLLTAAAFGDVTFSFNIKDLGAVAVTGTTNKVRFTLKNCGANQPKVGGIALIGAGSGREFYKEYFADSTGLVTGTIYGNDQITCGALSGTTTFDLAIYQNGIALPATNYLVAGTTFDPTTQTPNILIPTTTPLLTAVLTAPSGSQTIVQPGGTSFNVTGQATTTIGTAGVTTTNTINGNVVVSFINAVAPKAIKLLGTGGNSGYYLAAPFTSASNFLRGALCNNAYWDESDTLWHVLDQGASDFSCLMMRNGGELDFVTGPSIGSPVSPRTFSNANFLLNAMGTFNRAGGLTLNDRGTGSTLGGMSPPGSFFGRGFAGFQSATPAAATFSTATTGGTLLDSTAYFYRVSCLTNGTGYAGETLASTEASTTTGVSGANTNTVTINWVAVTGCNGYKVYGRTTGAELLIATTGLTNNTPTLTFTDNGSVTPAGALPSVNTSSTISIPGDITVTTTGTLTTRVRQFGNVSNFGGTEAMRVMLDPGNASQATAGGRYQTYTFHPLELRGNTRTATPPSFNTSGVGTTAAHVLAYGAQAGGPVFRIVMAGSQTADALQITDSAETAFPFTISAAGDIAFGTASTNHSIGFLDGNGTVARVLTIKGHTPASAAGGGRVTIQGGASANSGSAGGLLELLGGDTTTGNTTGGGVTIGPGFNTGTAAGANTLILGGTGTGAAIGGNVTITAGGSSIGGTGGNSIFQGGPGGNSAGTGGNAIIIGGAKGSGGTDGKIQFKDATDNTKIAEVRPSVLSTSTTAIVGISFTGTASLDFDLSGAGITCQDLTITVTGAADGDPVDIGVPNALASTAGVTFNAFVSGANTVTVRACDVTSGNPNPAAATVRATAWKY